MYFWKLKFVHEAVEFPVLDVHVFHLIVVAQILCIVYDFRKE